MKPLNPPFGSFSNKNIWIIGASSGIGEACAKHFSKNGANLILSARRLDALKALAASCASSSIGPSHIQVVAMDVDDSHSVKRAAELALTHWQKIDLLLFVSGVYEPMRADDFEFAKALKTLNTNLLGPMRVLGETLPKFIEQGEGHIAIVASVAGYSGLPKSLAYGPSKAALINFTESLYYDLHPKGVGVHLISPGFVATAATAINDFHMPALITPEVAANAIAHGLERGEFEIHFPKRFTYFLKLLRIMPYRIYFWALHRFVNT